MNVTELRPGDRVIVTRHRAEQEIAIVKGVDHSGLVSVQPTMGGRDAVTPEQILKVIR